jgi:hypothetical protein
MSHVARRISAPLLVLLSAVSAVAAHAQPAALANPGVAPPRDSLTATVRYVRNGGIDVITGVQLNLKLTHIAVDAGAVIRKQGQALALDALQPGDLVAIEYRETGRGKVAERIVVLPAVREDGG